MAELCQLHSLMGGKQGVQESDFQVSCVTRRAPKLCNATSRPSIIRTTVPQISQFNTHYNPRKYVIFQMWLGGTENVPKAIELGMRFLIKKTYLSNFVLNSKLAKF